MSDEIEQIFAGMGGTFGRFQLRTNLLLALVMGLSIIYSLDYVFVTLGLEYR